MTSRTKPILSMFLLLFAGCNVEKDKSEAQAVATQIHSQIQAGDYKTIYTDAGPDFQKGGADSQFVSAMEQMHQEYGSLKKASSVGYAKRFDTNAGTLHILMYDLEFDRKKASERIIFTRSDTGKMQLYDLAINPTN